MAVRNIIFDLDDTLIPNSHLYHKPTWECGRIISEALGERCIYPNDLMKRYLDMDVANVKTMGFSRDRFATTWYQLYNQLAAECKLEVDPKTVELLIDTANQFHHGPFAPYEGVEETLDLLRASYRIHLATAGDEWLQRKKIAESGLESFFDGIHIVGMDKKAVLAGIAGDKPSETMMVGDSKKSDILPAIELGLVPVWKPSTTWLVAHADVNADHHHTIQHVRDLPALLDTL